MTEYVQDPLFTLPEEQQILLDLSEARGANAELYQELARGGGRPDSVGVLMVKLEALLDCALSDAERARVELVFEQRMTQVLTDCQRQLVQQRLTAPAPGEKISSLFIPGQ